MMSHPRALATTCGLLALSLSIASAQEVSALYHCELARLDIAPLFSVRRCSTNNVRLGTDLRSICTFEVHL
ncbi:unnamed protein product [Calypogeia fissa]